MSATGRFMGGISAARRLGVTATVAAVLTVSAGVAAVAASTPVKPKSDRPRESGTAVSAPPAGLQHPRAHTAQAHSAQAHSARAHASQGRRPAAKRPERLGRPESATVTSVTRPTRPTRPTGSAPLALTAADRKHCPEAATACVDLARHLTWLQTDGKVSFGPIQMEPGQPGSAHATPRGLFRVGWKAGPDYMSTIYHEKMPYATFFGFTGVAFHGGSLTHWSHGCIHMTVANARLYQEKLDIGAEVAVF